MPSVELGDIQHSQRIALNRVVQYLVDEEGLSVDEVRSVPDSAWRVNRQARSNFGQSAHPYWFRLQLDQLDRIIGPVYMRVDYPHLDKLDIYMLSDGVPIKQYHLGDTVPFAERPIDNRIYLFDLNELEQDRVQVFIRVESQGPIELPLDVLTQSAFYERDKLKLIWFGAYFGIMMVMFLYNFFIFVLVRDVTYFYYLFYVASTAALQFTLTGASFQFIWPDSSHINNTMILVLTAMMPLAAVSFVRSFLNLQAEGHPFDRALAWVLLYAFIAVLVGALFGPYMVVLKVAHALSFIAVSVGFYLGATYWARGFKAARTFALAWFIYLVFIVVFLLDTIGITQPGPISVHALEIGSVLELVLLSLSFGHRINEEKEMRLHAQEQALSAQASLNKRLDEMVRQRTAELEGANLQLRELSIRDGLTGLFNRRHFDDLLMIEYQRSFREKNWVSVAMLDVDHFKNINDSYGHPFGDLCLKTIAEVVLGKLRRPPDVVARYGGEEFVIMLPGANPDGGRIVAEKIREAVAAIRLECDGVEVALTASVGVATVTPGDRAGYQQLLKSADQCLYQAKEAGRNTVIAHSG